MVGGGNLTQWWEAALHGQNSGFDPQLKQAKKQKRQNFKKSISLVLRQTRKKIKIQIINTGINQEYF